MFISVIVENIILKNNGIFTYHVNNNLKDKISVGKRVLVPFLNKEIEGFILKIEENNIICNYKIKDIIDVIDDEVILNQELLELGKYISDITLAPLISCYQVMLPRGIKAKNKLKVKDKLITYISLNKNINDIPLGKRQKEVIKALLKNKQLESSLFNSNVINSLLKKGLITKKLVKKDRLESNIEKYEKHQLNNEQLKVVNEILKTLNEDIIYLLHGVTGSGKTEVYLNVLENVLKENKTAIVLVPEISLTPQIIKRFKGRFGNIVAIFHSGLSLGEKYDEWWKIKEKRAKIVIGARSAIFAPLDNIGLIIIDEEHEATYKQDNNPRYHARDIAIRRSKYHKCPLILGSATPSLESYARAIKGNYCLLEIKKRANEKIMPEVKIIDMRLEKKDLYFSSYLIEAINKRLEKKEQIVLFLNKRGYGNIVRCNICWTVIKCPNCDITLTYHKTSDILRCHYCGYAMKKPVKCHNCKTGDIKIFGIGTEKIEEELLKHFKDTKVIRMDLDTTTNKGSHQRIIESFENKKYDVLLGTQMIAKGLDFPNVTLVGIISADMSLNIPDFRSSEVTFDLINQVSGRAGRGLLKGEVVIQTYNQDHYAIKYAKNHDYKSFFEYEMNIRKLLKYPPYYYLTLIKLSSKDYEILTKEIIKIKKFIEKNIDSNSIILGPTTCNMFKIGSIFNFQIVIKYKKDDKLTNTLIKLLNLYQNNNKIKIIVDINPLKL